MSTAVKKLRKLEPPPRGGATTMVEAIRAGIWEEMERDRAVFLIGEDVGVYGGAFKVTEGLINRFGRERVIDTPISEAAIVGAACGAALKGLIKAAIRDPDPVLFFEHKKLYRLPRLREELPEDDYIVEIGKARTAREGRDISIITFGAMVLTALDAAEALEKEGLDLEVID